MKAVFNSQYRKASGVVMTYAVIGTVAELTQYVAIQSAQANKTPDQWQRTASGAPLLFVQLNNLLRNGETPQPSYDLIVSHDGLRIHRDTTKADMARYARINALQEDKEANLMAELKLGIRTIGRTAGVATPATPAAGVLPAVPNTIGDIIADGIGEEELEPAGAGGAAGEAGTETL